MHLLQANKNNRRKHEHHHKYTGSQRTEGTTKRYVDGGDYNRFSRHMEQAYPLAHTVSKAASFYVDKVILRAYRLRQLGVLSVKYLRGTIVVFGILLISVLSTGARVDDPATAYNETDTPVNFTSSVSIARIARTNLIMVERPVTIFRGQREFCDGSATMYAITVKRALPASYARLTLLCTLLC